MTAASSPRERIARLSHHAPGGVRGGDLSLCLTAHGLNDYAGRPLGTDFSNIYAAGVSALQGDAAAAFDIKKQWHNEQAIFGTATPLYGWHYPPFFLLIAAPLAQFPIIPR